MYVYNCNLQRGQPPHLLTTPLPPLLVTQPFFEFRYAPPPPPLQLHGISAVL